MSVSVDRQTSKAPLRVLVLSDLLGPTQTINFARPLAAPISAGEALLKIVPEAELSGDPAAKVAALWRELSPTMLVFSRFAGGGHEPIIARARDARIPIVYHIDDDLLDVPQALGPEKYAHHHSPKRMRSLRDTASASDIIFASTPYLAAKMRKHALGPPVVAGDIACAAEPVDLRKPAPGIRQVIGYMATAGHARDLEIILPHIRTLLDREPNLSFEIFGSLPMPESLAVYGERVFRHPRVRDYAGFLRTLSSLDWWLGLAPLEDNEFNRCKTETKWLEYTLAGIPTVASNMEVYRRPCRGGAGFLVPDTSCWTAAITTLLYDSARRAEIVRRAQDVASVRYSLDRLRKQLYGVLEGASEAAKHRRSTTKSLPSSVAKLADGARPPHTRPVAPASLRLAGPHPGEYERWVAEHDTLGEGDRQDIASCVAALVSPPLISVALLPGPQDNQTVGAERTIASVVAQFYPHWELLVAAAPSAGEAGPPDERVRHLSGASFASMAEQARGKFLAFVEAGDILPPHALFALATAAKASPTADLYYSDEDELSPAGTRQAPYFKSGWNPELFLGQDFACRLAMLPIETARAEARGTLGRAALYDLLLRTVASRPDAVVKHLPFVLYHRQANRTRSPAEDGALDDARTAWLAKTWRASPDDRSGPPTVMQLAEGHARVLWPLPARLPKVSLIVPTRDRASLLRNCIEGLRSRTDYADLEILVVDNDSREPESLAYFASLSADPRIRVLQYPQEFNYSAVNNFAVAQSHGAVVGLLNNDLEVIHPDWLREMASQALRPDVGAVGALLHYADDTVQHAGVVLGIGGFASHIFKRHLGGSRGYCWRMALSQDLSAVTAACLVLRREVWDTVGGLDADFSVAYNDVDLCLRIRRAGYRVIWTPFARLYHLESASRGLEDNPEKIARFNAEKAKLAQRWGDALQTDPFFNPNLSLRSVDARPAFPPRVVRPWRRAT